MVVFVEFVCVFEGFDFEVDDLVFYGDYFCGGLYGCVDEGGC